MEHFADRERPVAVVHPTAIIHPGVRLGAGTTVEPFCILGSETGEPLQIGEGSRIRAYTRIEGGSMIGPRLETGNHTLIRRNQTIGDNLRIGSYTSLEGGASIGDFVRIHGRCEMTKGILRDFSRVYGGTYITDNRKPPGYVNAPCELAEGSVVTMGCVLIAGVRIGVGGYVAAGSVVARDVPDGMWLARDGGLSPVREFWPPRYRADYPEDAWPRLDALHYRMLALNVREAA